jgi:hypothetical protein
MGTYIGCPGKSTPGRTTWTWGASKRVPKELTRITTIKPIKNIETGMPTFKKYLQKRGLLCAILSINPLNLLVRLKRKGPSISIFNCFLNRMATIHMIMNPMA